MKSTQTLNWFFAVALGTAKYAAIFLLGVTLALTAATVFGSVPMAHLVMLFLWEWFWRIALLLLGLWTAGMMVESLR